jgi:vacuolar protein sorting-associated protein 16
MSWTSIEELLVLSEDGTYRLYTLNGEYRQYTLGAEVNELGVISAALYEDGLVVLHGGLGFVHVRGWEGGRAVPFGVQGEREKRGVMSKGSWRLIKISIDRQRYPHLLIAGL